MASSQLKDFPRVQVRPHGGSPALFIDGQPTFPLLLMTSASALRELQAIAPSAIHLLTEVFPLGWEGIGRHDFSAFDAAVRAFLAADPQAMLMPRVHLDAPTDWMDAHPGDVVAYADPAAWNGDTSWGGARHPSWASPRWRSDVGEALRALVRHARSSDYADRIIGWHLGSGIYGEWHHWDAVYYPDTSPAFVAAYGEWLAERYPGQHVDPRLPTIAERRTATLGMFRDPATAQWMVDHATFFHELGALRLAEFAAVVKAESDGRSLVLAFNGYLPDLDVNHEIDHRAFDRTLRDDVVDAFSSPHSYTRRAPGQDATMRGFLGSIAAMGKLFIDEADERTHLAHPTQWKHVSTREEAIEVLWRSFAQAVTHASGLWFMDQGGMWFKDKGGSWYADPAILAAFAQMRALGERSMARPRLRRSEVALVSSLTSAFHVADRFSKLDAVSNILINPTLEQWTKCGSPFDVYLLSELFEPTVPDYKVYAFLDTFFVSDADLARIAALKRAGRTLIFHYAPAFLSEHGMAIERMRDLLGVDVRLSDQLVLGDGREQRPGFVVPGMSGATARAGDVWYCPAPPLPAADIAAILASAGVHRWLDAADPLMVGASWVAVHAADDGDKRIRAPRPMRWHDARSGRTLANASAEITVRMTRGQTLLLEIDPA